VRIDGWRAQDALDELGRRTHVERGALRARVVALVLAGAVVDQGDGRFARGGS